MKVKVKSTSKFIAVLAVCAMFMVYLASPASAIYREGESNEVPEGQMQIMMYSETTEIPKEYLRGGTEVVEDSSKMAESGVTPISGEVTKEPRAGEIPEGAVAKGETKVTTTSAPAVEDSNNGTIITVVIGVVGIVLVLGYFFLRNRRKSAN